MTQILIYEGAHLSVRGDLTPKMNLRAWATHIQNLVVGPSALLPVASGYPITEWEFSDSTLGASELANLQAQCAFVHILGSGQGICSCGTGD